MATTSFLRHPVEVNALALVLDVAGLRKAGLDEELAHLGLGLAVAPVCAHAATLHCGA